MVSPYEEIAATRPRIRRDVLYTQTPTGVHFHNARGGFSVVMPSAYRFASLIVPHLTGEHTVEALCQGLGDKQRAMITQLVGTLYARGFARDAVPSAPGTPEPTPEVARRFGAQIDYVDHYTDDAAARFLRFRDTRVAVLGDDELARWAALSLIRNGCAAVAVPAGIEVPPGNRFGEVIEEAEQLRAEGCPVALDVLESGPALGEFGWDDLAGHDVVLVTGERGPRQIAALADGIPAGRRLVPVWTFGGSVVVGPLMTRDSTGCWTCAALRLGANGEAGDAADLWGALAVGGAGVSDGAGAGTGTVGGPLAAMVGNLLGYEVFRLTTGALPAETENQLIIQDMDSLDTVAEPLLPHPRCPACGARAGDVPDAGAAGLDVAGLGVAEVSGAAASAAASDGDAAPGEGDAAEAALAEINDRAVLVQPAAGVFQRYADETWAQTPLKVSTVTLSTGHGVRRDITAFDVHHVAGARLRALYRAAEVYAEHVVPLPEPLTGGALAAAREKWAAVVPAALSVASGLAPGADEVGAWCATTSLLGGATVLVPAGALRTFGPYNRERVAEPTSAGTGAGGSAREAAARGLLTALGHEALRGALHGTVVVSAVDPAALADAGDPELTFLVRSAANLGVALEILDLGSDGERHVPTVLARAVDPGTGEWRWAPGTAPRWGDAAREAVRDLLGAVQAGGDVDASAGESGPVDTGDPLIGDLAVGTLAVGGPPSGRPDLDGGRDWPELAARLRESGRDVLVAPVVAPDLAAGRVYAARVLLTYGGAPDAR